MYESRVCFLFTIFVACLQQNIHGRPQGFHGFHHPGEYFHSQHPYYGSYNQHASVSSNNMTLPNHTVPLVVEGNQTSPNVQIPTLVNNNYYSPSQPSPQISPTHGHFDPYAAPNQYHASHVPIPSPQSSMFHAVPHPAPFNSVSYPGLEIRSNPSYQTFPPVSPYSMGVQAQQAPLAQNHANPASPAVPLHQGFHSSSYASHPHLSSHVASDASHFNYPSMPMPPPPPPPPPAPTSSNLFAHYSGYPNQGVNSYSPDNSGAYGYNSMPYGLSASNHFAGTNYAIQNRESSGTSTSKKVTPTTPRPKTTTTKTPKPLEFELSIEDFFYLTQLHQMFNKSLDKQGIDISSFVSKSHKKSGEEKDESPVFYGGVLDLDELSKIDNIKDLMEVFKRGGSLKSQTISQTDAETGASDNPDEDHEADEEQTHPEAADGSSSRRKGSPDATRTRTALRNRHKKNKQKKRRKESERADHGNEDEEQEEEDESSDHDSEPETTDEKIGIGSKPSNSQVNSATYRKQRIRTSQSTTTTTTATPPAMYHNPYLISLPYNYPQLQQQYFQQLQAMSGHMQSSLARPAEKEVAKFPDDEPLASPNENRNVINVNIADPRKVGDSLTSDASSGNQETPSATRFPLRRGSFNSMANGLAKKALSSILYRIFPTMKHLNVRGVAARGCRDVQSIGSLDSIIMPLGLAVTLHPLLLPLVPFLLLALGSIKAIESATCFVSEYFT